MGPSLSAEIPNGLRPRRQFQYRGDHIIYTSEATRHEGE